MVRQIRRLHNTKARATDLAHTAAQWDQASTEADGAIGTVASAAMAAEDDGIPVLRAC
jgi:hypothetical protein